MAVMLDIDGQITSSLFRMRPSQGFSTQVSSSIFVVVSAFLSLNFGTEIQDELIVITTAEKGGTQDIVACLSHGLERRQTRVCLR